MSFLYNIHDWLLDLPNRLKRTRLKHDWSEPFEIGGGPDYEAVDTHGRPTGIVIHPVRRRLQMCHRCGATDATAIIQKWCIPREREAA